MLRAESMRQQLVITLVLIVVLCTALFVKVMYFPQVYGHNAYYFISIFWICGTLVVIFLLNLIWTTFTGTKPQKKAGAGISWPNRRRTFRVIYPNFIRPKLVLERADNQVLRNLEFSIVNLSQGGTCFLNDGSLGTMERFSGYIQFDNGERVNVSGQYIRENENHISVRFSQPIAWSTLLEEQRRVMGHLKPGR